MEEYIKTTKGRLSGIEKAAILLAEIGPVDNKNYDALFESLHLSTDEVKKIRKAMERLGPYSPGTVDRETGMMQISREQSVLMEAISFGMRRGIFTPVESSVSESGSGVQQKSSEMKDLANQNPEAVAKILKSWLGE